MTYGTVGGGGVLGGAGALAGWLVCAAFCAAQYLAMVLAPLVDVIAEVRAKFQQLGSCGAPSRVTVKPFE